MVPERIELNVDGACEAYRSVALRYAPALLDGVLAPDDLRACSRREGIRLLDLGEVDGVRLWAMDETTGMASGTHKSLDGCVTAALCRRLGIARAAFSSGANGGSALTLYGAAAGLETFFFCPAGNLGKLDGALFDRPGAHLVAVEGSDRRVKEACRLFAEAAAVPAVPRLEWRLLSAACRGLFLAEQVIRLGRRFTWLAQSVCAGYGPIGIYRALGALAAGGQLDAATVPRFLGVQQAGLCPMVRAWERGLAHLPPLESTSWREGPIEPVLYNVYPDETYPLVHALLRRWGGDMLAVGHGEFDRHAEVFLRRLEGAGVALTRVGGNGPAGLLEKAGLLAGAGAIKAIRQGTILPGQSVLCALTGGAGPAPTRPARAAFRIGPDVPLPRAVRELAEAFGGADRPAEGALHAD